MAKSKKIDTEIFIDLISNDEISFQRTRTLFSKKKKAHKALNEPILFIKSLEHNCSLADLLKNIKNDTQLTLLVHCDKNFDFVSTVNDERWYYSDLAQYIKNNIPEHINNMYLNIITCYAASGDDYTKSFAYKLQKSLYEKGVNTDLVTRTEIVSIANGRKYTLKEDKTINDLKYAKYLLANKKITLKEFKNELYNHHYPGSKVISFINPKNNTIHVHDAYLKKLFDNFTSLIEDSISVTNNDKLKNGLSLFRDEIASILENNQHPAFDFKKLCMLIQHTESAINKNDVYHFYNKYFKTNHFWQRKKFIEDILPFLIRMKKTQALYATKEFKNINIYPLDSDDNKTPKRNIN